MTTSPKNIPDAQLIAVWDMPLDLGKEMPMLLHHRGEVVSLSLEPLRIARDIVTGESWLRNPAMRLFNKSCQQLSSDQRKVLIDGRKQWFILLNSTGGELGTLNQIREACAHVRETGGQIVSFVSGEAGSAAADVFSQAQSRHLLETSHLMWHVSEDEEEPLPPAEIRRETQEYFSFLIENTVRKKRAGMRRLLQAAIRDSQNPRNEVRFSGSDLQTFGIAEAHVDTKSLRAVFEKETGLKVHDFKEKEGGNHVKKFFFLSELAETSMEKFGVRGNFHLGENGKISVTCDPLDHNNPKWESVVAYVESLLELCNEE